MLDASIWDGVERLLEAVVHEVVKPYAVQADVAITKGVPPVVNDAGCIDALTAAVTGTGSFVAQTPQSLGGEDFAWYLTHVPGAMARLGTRAPAARPTTCTAATSSSTRARSSSVPAPWPASSSPQRPSWRAPRPSPGWLRWVRSRIGNTSCELPLGAQNFSSRGLQSLPIWADVVVGPAE